MISGQIVATGSLTGITRSHEGEKYVADFGPFGEVAVAFAR